MLAFIATQNFERANEILSAPPPELAKAIENAGSGNARMLLRHLVGEENRSFFSSWELAQFGIGALLTAVLFIEPSSRKLAGLSAAMLVLTAFAHFIMTPELIWLGRSIEFLPVDAASKQRDQFSKLHVMYGVMEGAKILLGCVLAVLLFTMSRRRHRQKEQLDVSDLAAARTFKG